MKRNVQMLGLGGNLSKIMSRHHRQINNSILESSCEADIRRGAVDGDELIKWRFSDAGLQRGGRLLPVCLRVLAIDDKKCVYQQGETGGGRLEKVRSEI